MLQSFKIFVLPPLLTLAIVAPTLMLFTSYLSARSQRTTYVVAGLQRARPCSFCHGSFFARSTGRVAALRFRLATP